MKQIIKVAMMLSFVLSMMFAFSSCSANNKNPEVKYFGIMKYAETMHICSKKDKEEIYPILDKIEKAFSYDDEKHDCKEELGELSRYCICRDTYPYVVSENHSIEFITANLKRDNGYVWIRYSSEGLDKNGEVYTGSWDILSRIELKNIDGVWVAVDIDEAP